MGWLYLLGALVFPPAFLLWRPREPLSPRERRIRIAGSIVVVWMLTILWALRGSIGADAKDELRGEVHDFTPSRQKDLGRRSDGAEATTRPGDRASDGRTDAAPADDVDVAYDWRGEATGYAGLMLALGWAPGLVYAGLLLLARKAIEPPQAEVVDDPGRPWQGGGPYER